ncbi:phage tail tape measure protein [Sulfurimonas sp.]|uniref:phage tail tape measure protein n=1 Tax=Sulfurimonas sp. TaxID=2022749 RepID=UPI0025ECBC02|nr:phage tail tape measure protein [Sulfurimonas sp.]
MSTLLTLGIILSATDKLSPILASSSSNLDKLDSKIGSVSANITKLGTASLALGLAITAPLKSALNDYQNLAAAQGDIASLGIDDSGIKAITKSAREFSNEFAGTTAPEFIKASYDIKSGISSLTDEGVAKFTKLSALTASATKSTTGEMTELFALGYGIFKNANEDDFEFGERMSAQIARATLAFRTDGGDLTLGISNIGAQAKKMGVSLSEELSIIGNAKGAFKTASEAATGYRAFLDGASSAQDKLGLSFTDSEGKMLPMVQVLQKIKDKYGDGLGTLAAQKEIKDAFGSGEAVKIVNALVDKTYDLTKSQKELENATMNNVKAMAKARNKGKEFVILGQQMNNVSTLIGGAFAPLALSLSETIGGVVKSVSSWMEENEELSSTIFTGIAVIGGLLTVLGSVGVVVGAVGMAMPFLSGGIGLLTGSFGFLGTAIKVVSSAFLTNPIGLAVTAIATAAYLIYDNWEPISEFFINLWDGIGTAAEPVLNWLESKIGAVTEIISSISSFFGLGGDISATVKPVSSKANNTSIENIQKDVLSSNISNSNQLIYNNNRSNQGSSKVIHNTPTYHIVVTSPTNNVDVIKAIKEHEHNQRNRQYEDE